jgi:hypothetical protein
MDSLELTEWEAYERYAGPLGDSYEREALAAVHEQIQRTNRVLGAAHFTDRKHKKNPVPEPKDYPRPHEIFPKTREDPEDEDQMDEEAMDTFGATAPEDDGGGWVEV